MSTIFKKLFSKKTKPEAETVEEQAEEIKSRKLAPRAPRIYVRPLGTVFFSQVAPLAVKRVEAFNISTSGIGLVKGSYSLAPEVDSLLHGLLIIGSKRHAVTVKVVHISDTTVGTQYQKPSTEMVQDIDLYFRVEFAAIETIKVDPKYHKQELDGISHWIHGDHVDLYYVSNADKIVRLRLTFFDNYVEIIAGKSHVFGKISEGNNSSEKVSAKVAQLVNPQPVLETDQIDTLFKLLKYIPHLPEVHRNQIVQMISAAK